MAPPPASPYRRLILALLGFEALLVLAFAFGSGQSELMDLTGIGDGVLHLFAFGLAATLAGTIFPPLPVAAGLFGFAVLIEIGQSFTAGREASLIDLLVGGSGVALGLLVARVLLRLTRRVLP